MLSKLKIFVSAFRYVVWSVFISSIPSYRFRNWYLRRVLRFQVAPSAAIHVGCWVTGFRFCVGAHSVINRNCRLDARGGITIGNNVSISPECYLISASHDPHSPSFSGTVKSTAVIIHDYAWLGVRVLVLPGVTIGRGAIVGAGAVVSRDVPAMAIVVGNPAKIVNTRQCEPDYVLKWEPWFDTDIM